MALSAARYGSLLTEQTALLAAHLEPSTMGRDVPACPEWTLAQLAAHVGGVQRWVATLIQQRAPRPLSDVDPSFNPPAGADAAALAAWLREGAALLAGAAAEAGLDAAVWTWSGDDRVGFWLRRMTLEAAVHAVDAQVVTGEARPIPADLAADGISEWLWIVSLPTAPAIRPLLLELRGEGETLHFHATDDGLGEAGEWMVHRTPAGVRWEHGHGKGEVAVRGAASDLYLLMMRRLEPGTASVQVLGDPELLDHWLERTPF
jgi:uncharacterized protein (TIGR03083 family)